MWYTCKVVTALHNVTLFGLLSRRRILVMTSPSAIGATLARLRTVVSFLSAAVLSLGVIATSASADTVRVADFGDGTCSLANAQAAHDVASAADTVLFPPGACTWSSALRVTKPLIFIGAGSAAGGTTLIASGTMATGFFYISGVTSSGLLRISGFRFEMVNLTPRYGIKIAEGTVELTNLRIDHNVFNQGLVPIDLAGAMGVVDHNYFYNHRDALYFTAGSEALATASWVSLAAGTANALFIEDNHFVIDAAYVGTYAGERIGTYNGGKLVVRYNDFDSTASPLSETMQPIETHGSAAGGVANGYWQLGTGARRGQSVVEIYNNTMRGKRIDFFVKLRGSTNLVHNNAVTITGGTPTGVLFQEDEFTSTSGGPSNWSPRRTEGPGEDQVHNSFVWANTLNGGLLGALQIQPYPRNSDCTESGYPYTCCTGTGTGKCAVIVEGRDYFAHAPAATGGSQRFSCVTGVTACNGASSSYPTDGNTYPTLGTLVFDPSGANAHYPYAPYVYPHPLTGPRAPGSVRIVK